VSSLVQDDVVVRAWIECPECMQKQPDLERQIEILQAEMESLRYVMSHVPARVLMKAKEKAGCPTLMVLAGGKTCDTCDGSGRVVETTTHTVDRGTKWQRSADEQIEVECPSCNGDGCDESPRVLQRTKDAAKILLGACQMYCSWYGTGRPAMDGGSMAYELVSDIRRCLESLDVSKKDEAKEE